MPCTVVGFGAIAATTICHAAMMKPEAIAATAPTCRTFVVATLARRGCQWTCVWTWGSIATFQLDASGLRALTRLPRKAQDRARSTAVDDRAIETTTSAVLLLDTAVTGLGVWTGVHGRLPVRRHAGLIRRSSGVHRGGLP